MRILRFASLALVVVLAMSLFAACDIDDVKEAVGFDTDCVNENGDRVPCPDEDDESTEGTGQSTGTDQTTTGSGGDTTTGTTQTTDQNGTSTTTNGTKFGSTHNQNTTTTTSSDNTQQNGNGTGWWNAAPQTGFTSNTNFLELATCEPQTEEFEGATWYVFDTNNCEGNGVYYQTSKLKSGNVRLVVHDDEAANVDGYDVNGYPGVNKGFGPGDYRLVVSDGAIFIGSDQAARDRHCSVLAMAMANSWLMETVEPLDGWSCGS